MIANSSGSTAPRRPVSKTLERLAARQCVLDNGHPWQRLALGTLGGQIDLCGFVGPGGPVEGRGESLAGGVSALLRGVGIVQYCAHRISQRGHIAWRTRHSGLPV